MTAPPVRSPLPFPEAARHVRRWSLPTLGLLALLLAAPAAAQTFNLGVRVDLATGSFPFSVAIGDLNGDGWPDLVTTNRVGSSVSVFLGTGAGGFAAKTDFATGSGPAVVAIGDVSGDGRPDLAVANGGSNTVSVLLGNGAGGFGAKTDFATGSTPRAVAIADVNGDGRPDLAVTNIVSQSVSVLLGTGAGGFGAKTDFTTAVGPQSVAIADMNDDGLPDLVVGNNSSNSISLLLGNGTGGFGANTDFATGTGPASVAVGDLNNDGLPDLATANHSASTVSVLPGNGAGGFGARVDFATGTSPTRVALGDMNGDGRADLVTSNQHGHTASVLLGDGAGGFGAKTDFAAGTSCRSVAIGDLNGDGRRDLAVLNELDDSVSLLFGNGAGGFRAKTDFATGTNPASVAIRDVSGDGSPDLAVANEGANSASVLLGNGTGGFGPATGFPAGSQPSSVAVGDVSGDTVPDLVVANYLSSTVSVLLGNGAGGFGPKTDFAAGSGRATSVAIGDVSGDSDPDLVVANAYDFVSVLLGDGAGGFAASVDYTVVSPSSVAIGNLNADTWPDLALTNPYANSVTVMLGTGAGVFAGATYFPLADSPGPQSLAIGDVNGDGRLDLAVANVSAGAVSVLLNDGAGNFGAPVYFPAGSNPSSVAIGDVSGDGRPDLVVASSNSNAASVLLGNGAGGFGPRTVLPTGDLPWSVAIGDVSGDGRLDLALPNYDSHTVSVLLGLVPTRTTVLVHPNPVAQGGQVTLTGIVSIPAPGYGAPTDSVRFFDGTTLLGVAPVFGGAAEITVTAAHPGDRAITAEYKGDGKLFPSISPVKTLRVGFGPANCRFATAVVGFSSQLGTPNFGAIQALGPPNVYPRYGLDPAAWASSTEDGSLEYLQLAFTDPAPINFVNVYETLDPGAVAAISVKNPGTGAFQVVWSGIATGAQPLPRLFTATFPETPFAVSEILISINSPAAPGHNAIDAVSIGKIDHLTSSQWAAGVVSFSSQWVADGPSNWYAVQALGPPDVYPLHSDDPRAWSSLGPDDPDEFLHLSFATPSAINFVNVVETWKPGTLSRVLVKNPDGLFEPVWSGTAAPAPEVARIHTVSFPETRFLVSEVKLEFDSPAVPLWNEIDAVGIGRCACQASLVDVPAPDAATFANAIEWARPNPFSVSTGVAFSLARAGKVKVEVFNVAGQRVARLLDRALPAGRHAARWDGRDTHGRTVASGIYYLRLESDELSETRKVVKLE